MHSVTSMKFTLTALTSKQVKYANACPAGHVTGLEVRFLTLHIVEPLVLSTRALATLSPIPEVRWRVSVIPVRVADPRDSDTGIRALCRAGIRFDGLYTPLWSDRLLSPKERRLYRRKALGA